MATATRLEPGGDHDEVHRIDCAGATAFLAIHRVIEGRSFGGIRIGTYPDEDAALADALDLARAMSRKVVLSGIAAGGAKCVLMAPAERRREAVLALGRYIESLQGRYFCGPDMGYTDADDAALRETTTHVAPPGLGRVTAQGVRLALRAACDAERVAIQGLGAVGAELARMLLADGAAVAGCDVRPVEDLPGVRQVPLDTILDEECDVFAPCARGGVLGEASIARLRCRVVCGAANNPLVEAADADRLHARGIVYVPDFVANAAAVIQGASEALGEADLAHTRIAAIADRTREILEVAAREDRSPHHVAVEMADAAVARASS